MVTILAVFGSQTRAFRPCSWPFGRFLAHSSLQPLQKPAPRHPQIAQRKQRHQVGRVLGQPSVLDFHVANLPLDDPKRVLHLGTYAGFHLFELVQDGTHGVALVQRPALSRAHGHMPIGFDALNFFALGHTLVAGIGKYIGFFTMDQLAGLRHVVDVGRCSHHGVHQARVGIDADMNTKGLPASK